ncbi:MAG TPA: APC family permease [Methanomassiliicoccales archaeon]
MKKTLTLRDATAINLGAIIGSGIFVVTGIAAGAAGPALIVSILIAAGVSLLTALSLTDLSRATPKEGGIYAYSYRNISPYAGFLAGWMYIIGNILGGAAVALGFSFYFHVLVPEIDFRVVVVGAVVFFTMINYLGAKDSARINNLIVLVKMMILTFFIIFGALFLKAENLTPFQPLQGGVLLGAYYIFFAFGGFARITNLSEEVDDPQRTIPKAILLSLAISTVFYMLVGIVAIGMVGSSGLASSNSPLEYAMGSSNNGTAVTLVVIGGLMATASVMLTSILGVSRIEYSMARRRAFPLIFTRLNESSGIPYVAVIATGVAVMALALTGDLVSVISISTFAQLFYYALTNVSASRMRKEDRRFPYFVPVLGAFACLAMLGLVLLVSPWAWLGGLLCLAVGSVLYLARKMSEKRESNKAGPSPHP